MNFNGLFIIGVLFCSLFSCEKKYTGKPIPILAHAASGLYNPKRLHAENSKEAIDYALSFEGLAGLELDVQMSKDATIWLFHDENLAENTSGKGRIIENSDEALSEVTYNSLNRAKIVRLKDVDFSSAIGTKDVFLDIKVQFDLLDSVSLDLFFSQLLEFKTKYAPFVNMHIILKNHWEMDLFNAYGIDEFFAGATSFNRAIEAMSLGYKGVFIRNNNISTEEVLALKESGMKVVLFDVRTLYSIRRALKKNPDFLMVEDFKTAILELN